MEDDAIQRNITCVYTISEAQSELFNSFSWWLEGFGSLLIGSGGIVMNIIAICVILKSELKTSFFYWLLICLAICDSTFLLNCVLESFRRYMGSTPLHNYIFAVFLFPFRSVAMLCSIYITVGISVERYNAIVHPVSHQRNTGMSTVQQTYAFHRKRLFKYIGPIIVFSICFYIPRYFEVKVDIKKNDEDCLDNFEFSNCTVQYLLQVTDLRKDENYVLWYINILNLVVTCLIPLLSIMYLNYKVYFALKNYMKRIPSLHTLPLNITSKSKEKQHNQNTDKIQQTTTLFGIIIVFVICHALRIILNIEELCNLESLNQSISVGCNPWSFSFMVRATICSTLLQINCSINFLVYCALNKRYKKVFLCYASNCCRCLTKLCRSTATRSKGNNYSQSDTAEKYVTNTIQS